MNKPSMHINLPVYTTQALSLTSLSLTWFLQRSARDLASLLLYIRALPCVNVMRLRSSYWTRESLRHTFIKFCAKKMVRYARITPVHTKSGLNSGAGQWL
jgi:hypothetical protein